MQNSECIMQNEPQFCIMHFAFCINITEELTWTTYLIYR